MEEKIIKKPKIEAIYPLTSMQQGLLFHHLTAQKDEGFLIVECTITGNLDKNLLKEAWKKATLRHEVMRTSVHWKNVEQPVLLVRPEKNIDWTFLNWTDKNPHDQNLHVLDYKNTRSSDKVALEKNPLSKITVIQKSTQDYTFLWECHHLLLDGWSSTIILKDAFSFYKGLVFKTEPQLPLIPTYKAYRNYLKNSISNNANVYWKKTFSNFTKAPLFNKNSSTSSQKNLQSFNNQFSAQTSIDIKNLAKHYKVTLNTLFQGIWSLMLSKCFNSDTVLFGVTVSGRSIPFPNIELMTGMFTNVLPVHNTLDSAKHFQNSLQLLQSQQQEARNYEHNKIDEIVKWANLPDNTQLFDNLYVFENIPWETIDSGNIKVEGFKGGITSTYPITVVFTIEESISYELLVDTNIIPTPLVNWIASSLKSVVSFLLSANNATIGNILEHLSSAPNNLLYKQNQKNKHQQDTFKTKDTTYTAPKNETQLKLIEIWEELFCTNCISITDNFFHLGGKSLLSVKMFTIIEEKLGVKLPPTILLESPTIEGISKIITSKSNTTITHWKYLVPIKSIGKKVPLFCIHAGGGHVFFYKSLADALDSERPVYALQPVGIFGEDNKHANIENMAKDYADEISNLQPEGTLNILVYCFSTAVGLEMASYLKTLGRNTHLIVADTIAEHRLLLNKERLSIRTSAFLKRFFSNPFKALNEMIGYRIFFYLKPIGIHFFGTDAEKNTEQMRQHLVSIFNNYTWNKKTNKVSLVLTEKGDERYNQEIIRSWTPIVTGPITVETTQGKHSTFFENPDVNYAAQAIDKVMIEL